MGVIGSSLPISIPSYSGIPAALQTQVTQAVQSDPALADPTLQLLRGLSGFDATSLTGAPPAPAGTITSPQDAYATQSPQLFERYGERVQLPEQTETVRSTVNQNTAAKKGATPQTQTPEQTVRIPPAQVENKLRTDPAFRAQLEQRLGGRIVLDDTADGNITVERERPVDRNALQAQAAVTGFAAGALLPALAAADVSRRLDRIGQRLGNVLEQLGGPAADAGRQLQGTDGSNPQWSNRFASTFELSLKATFGDGPLPASSFGGVNGIEQGFLSGFRGDAGNTARQFAETAQRFGSVLDHTLDVFNSAQLGVQRAQYAGG